MPNSYVNKVIVNGITRLDLTGDTISADKLMSGFTAHDRTGAAITGTASGDSLNLNVVAYASSFPLAAAENTIGVISTTMTDWCLQADEPQSPSAGLVWVKLGLSSTTPISVSRTKSVMCYPISAKEWDGSSWVTLPARCYQNGAWTEWNTVVIYNKIKMMTMTLSGNAVFNANGLYLGTGLDAMEFSHSRAFIELDFNTINTIKITAEIHITTGMGPFTVHTGITDNPNTTANPEIASLNMKSTDGMHDFTLSTINITGTHYMLFYVNHRGALYYNYITDLRGEP